MYLISNKMIKSSNHLIEADFWIVWNDIVFQQVLLVLYSLTFYI